MPTTYVQDVQNVFSSNATYSFDNGSWTYDSGSAQFPVYVPMISSGAINPPFEPPKDDSPLAWLRREVEEICDLATAV